MKTVTKTRTETILVFMNVLAWVAFIGLSIKAGAIFISFLVSCFNPNAAQNLYEGLNVYSLRNDNLYQYILFVSFLISLTVMQAYIAYLIVKTLTEVKLLNPFTLNVAHKIESISWVLLGIWLVSALGNGYSKWLMKSTGQTFMTWEASEYLFLAGLVFIISQIFKRGVEIQAENELTV